MSTREHGHLTLEQIGSRAGVSRSTVSRVLNDHPDVRPDVRARVEAVIRETGYEPNAAARALVSKRSGLIGLVMLAEVDELFGDPYYSALVHGIRQGCAEHNLIFAIFPATSSDGTSDALTPQIAQRFVDGVIVTAVPQSRDLIERIHGRGKRMVVVGPDDDAFDGVTRVDVENRAGSAAAVAHLIAHGRRRIAFIGPPAEYRYGADRLDGYRDALAAAGLPFDPALVHEAEHTAQSVRGVAEELFAGNPDACFAATDWLADGVLQSATDVGLRVPEDLAVMGFDGLPNGPAGTPTLATVVQPVLDVGRMAVALLADDDETPRTVVLPTTLRPAASCAATHD